MRILPAFTLEISFPLYKVPTGAALPPSLSLALPGGAVYRCGGPLAACRGTLMGGHPEGAVRVPEILAAVAAGSGCPPHV